MNTPYDDRLTGGERPAGTGRLDDHDRLSGYGTTPRGRPVGDLLRSVADDAASLIRGEIRLARSEAEDKIGTIMGALVAIVGGFILALAALIILLDAVVYGLSQAMPMWAAALITGGVVALIAFILVRQGEQALHIGNLAPERTGDQLRKDAQLVKDKLP